VTKVGRTSLQIRVDAWRRARAEEASERVPEATVTVVALDEERRPRPVPAEA
jgi:acyl-CoA thioesterase YciA